MKCLTLTRSDFLKNPDYYQDSFDEIFKSQGLQYFEFWPFDLTKFFDSTPIASIVYARNSENKIVSVMWCKPSEDLTNWSVCYTATHKQHENHKYAKALTFFAFQDVINQGCLTLTFVPCGIVGRRIYHSLVEPFYIGEIHRVSPNQWLYTITFNDFFISSAKESSFADLAKNFLNDSKLYELIKNGNSTPNTNLHKPWVLV